MGIKTLLALSDGSFVENPRHTARYERQLVIAQRELSRKQGARKGETPSKNYEKQRIKVARIHERIANSRKDTLHKATTALIKENQVICIETLKSSEMMKNHQLAKSVADASFDEISRQLQYKAAWYGRELIKVGKWFPSTKTCSHCGHIQEIGLDERIFECHACGKKINRDSNAAWNILSEGIRIRSERNARESYPRS